MSETDTTVMIALSVSADEPNPGPNPGPNLGLVRLSRDGINQLLAEMALTARLREQDDSVRLVSRWDRRVWYYDYVDDSDDTESDDPESPDALPPELPPDDWRVVAEEELANLDQDKGYPTELDSRKVRADRVNWTAAGKHTDEYFHTATLDRGDLERLLAEFPAEEEEV